ncbi:hypothetical protein N9K17_05420 [Burkholderiaceae bacterium]|nr:hypothetical protein [Burkholderiaceae bacterium]
MLANVNFRQMPLAARGLLYTLRLECWENHRLPADSKKLSSVLRFDEAEIIAAMQWLDPFFQTNDGWITSPDLEDYRTHLAGQRKAQSVGGKKGAAKTNAGKSRVPRESVVKSSTDQLSPVHNSPVSNEEHMLDKSWEEYQNEP